MKNSRVRVRQNPRISINKLGEYLTGTPFNRKSIISEQKRPPVFKSSYYQAAEKAITDFLSGDILDQSRLDGLASVIKSAESKGDYQISRKDSNYQAVKSFKSIISLIDGVEEYKITRGNSYSPKLELSGVKVSVRPELVISSKESDTDDIGVIKLYFSKNEPLDEETGNYIVTATHHWVMKHLLAPHLNAPRKMTMVIDVFNNQVFYPPNAFKKRMKDIRAACDEIRMIWPHL